MRLRSAGVRSAREECLRKMILFGEDSLRRALTEYVSHFHSERNHQGKDNRLLFPEAKPTKRLPQSVLKKQRLGGLLNYYCRGCLSRLTIRDHGRHGLAGSQCSPIHQRDPRQEDGTDGPFH